MQLQPQTLQQALSPAFQRQPVIGQQYRQFNYALQQYLAQLRDAESQDEDHIRNIVKGFLEKAVDGTRHYVNPKSFGKGSGIDLAVHNGAKATAPVGVLIEVKQPANKAEMITPQAANRKALHEAIFYYLIEREENHNNEVKHIIVTDGWEWFLFDAQAFHRHFYEDKHLIDQFRKYRAGQLDFRNTGGFYEVIQQVVAGKTETLTATHISLPAYQAYLRQAGYTVTGGTQGHLPLQEAEEPYTEKTEEALTLLQKALSAQHLLKQPLENDSNSLNKAFYEELLYIMGLEEAKEGNKKVIQLDQDGSEGSLMALTMNQLDSEELVDQEGMETYGTDRQERLFQVALQLNITWLNRILFLKLLEAQLISYHQGDQQQFGFMKPGNLKDFDELNTLFVKVLAKKPEDRTPTLAERYADVPYLNSSLFELPPLEKATIRISNLEDQAKMPCMAKSVLKADNKQGQATQTFPTLEYLLRFLDAYDFGAEGYQRVKQDNKPLISASVLGLVFEKINGYREGSFFTPGFITMYMARETLRKTVLDKFSEQYHLSCDTLAELSNAIRQQQIKPADANAVIDNLKICDPAVGSGHFLVSVLNELIAIKSELGILTDYHGQLLDRYEVTVSNDELEVTNDDHQRFQYTVSWDAQTGQRRVNKDTQRLQQALFHEKQQLIENCLFGVDLNTNSVQICRLRLWIELLKNAYYRADENYQRLETLPNIDINIKEGNSLISRFSLDMELQSILQKVNQNRKKPISLQDYQMAVDAYKQTNDPAYKKELQEYITTLKDAFREELKSQSPIIKKLSKVRGDLTMMENPSVFGEQQYTDKQIETKRKELEKLEQEKADLENNVIYRDAFEWRFEFPEVLDEKGKFLGFDVVIGNPPYIHARENFSKAFKNFVAKRYETVTYQISSSNLFVELGFKILKSKGLLSLIIPNYWISTDNDKNLRKLLFNNWKTLSLVNTYRVFKDAIVDTLLLFSEKDKPKNSAGFEIKSVDSSLLNIEERLDQINKRIWGTESKVTPKELNDDLKISFSKRINYESSGKLNDLFELKFGIKVYQLGKGDPPQTEYIISQKPYDAKYQVDETFIPLLRGKNIHRFGIKYHQDYYVKYGNNLAEPRELKMFKGPRILLQRIVGKHHLKAAYTKDFFLCNSDVITLIPKEEVSEDDVLFYYAILTSKIALPLIKMNNVNLDRAAFPKINTKTLSSFPLPRYFHNKDKIVKNINKILDSKKNNPNGDTSKLEKEMDQMVYELYGLTKEEVEIVENNI